MKAAAIFGTPRSGTSWVGQIFNSSPNVAYRYQPLFSYEFKGRISENSNKENIEKFYKDLLATDSDFILQKTNLSGREGILFPKNKLSTLVWKEVRYLNIVTNLIQKTDTKAILIARHPAATINSWLGIPKEFKESWDPIKEWRYATKKNAGKAENYYGYERWKEAMQLFLSANKKYPQQALIVKYEDLIEDNLAVTEKMFEFCSIPLEAQTKEFITSSTSSNDHDPYGVFRKTPDPNRWQKELDKRITSELLEDFNKSTLKKELGY